MIIINTHFFGLNDCCGAACLANGMGLSKGNFWHEATAPAHATPRPPAHSLEIFFETIKPRAVFGPWRAAQRSPCALLRSPSSRETRAAACAQACLAEMSVSPRLPKSKATALLQRDRSCGASRRSAITRKNIKIPPSPADIDGRKLVPALGNMRPYKSNRQTKSIRGKGVDQNVPEASVNNRATLTQISLCRVRPQSGTPASRRGRFTRRRTIE